MNIVQCRCIPSYIVDSLKHLASYGNEEIESVRIRNVTEWLNLRAVPYKNIRL